jgi:hypothetical protein
MNAQGQQIAAAGFTFCDELQGPAGTVSANRSLIAATGFGSRSS